VHPSYSVQRQCRFLRHSVNVTKLQLMATDQKLQKSYKCKCAYIYIFTTRMIFPSITSPKFQQRYKSKRKKEGEKIKRGREHSLISPQTSLEAKPDWLLFALLQLQELFMVYNTTENQRLQLLLLRTSSGAKYCDE